jgi:hypothetical protein
MNCFSFNSWGESISQKAIERRDKQLKVTVYHLFEQAVPCRIAEVVEGSGMWKSELTLCNGLKKKFSPKPNKTHFDFAYKMETEIAWFCIEGRSGLESR